MKQTIIRFKYESLRNNAHVQFSMTMVLLIDKYTAELLGIDPQYNHYCALVEIEQQALDAIIKSSMTDELSALDKERNDLFRGVVQNIQAGRNHYEEAKRKAADDLYMVVRHYGNLSAKPADEKTAAIDDFYRELTTPENTGHVNTLGMKEWTLAMVVANRKFNDMMMARYNEIAQRPKVNMRACRVETDKQFRLMLNYIEALHTVDTTDKYNSFINELNVIMERYRNILEQEKGIRKANKDKEEETTIVEIID